MRLISVAPLSVSPVRVAPVRVAPVSVALMLGLAPGCVSMTCNTLYAPEQVDIVVDAASLEPGTYVIEALGESCTVTLPGSAGASCDGAVLGVTLDSSGSTITHISLWEAAPDTLDLVIRLDDVEIFAETVTPTYTVSEPNGKGCGEVPFGTAEISL